MKNLILLIGILFSGICSAQTVQEVDNFSKIKIDANAEVEIVYSNKSQVVFNKDSEELENLSVISDNKSLVISKTSKEELLGLKIRIYTNDVRVLFIQGKTSVTFSKFTYQDNMLIIAKQGATVNTGDTKIKNLQINRSSNSEVTCSNAKTTKEIVDGLLIAAN